MTIASIKLDESTKLDFGVSITGTGGRPEARFVIDHKDFSVSFPCKQTNEGMEADVQGMSKIFAPGDYTARLEVIIENKLYVPLIDKITFQPLVQIKSQAPSVTPMKESVIVGKVTINHNEINESELRRTQAATIIAQSLNYKPEANETPAEIIENAVNSVEKMTPDQIETLQQMLKLAEDVGIKFNKPTITE
jgi:hypothetical protein